MSDSIVKMNRTSSEQKNTPPLMRREGGTTPEERSPAALQGAISIIACLIFFASPNATLAGPVINTCTFGISSSLLQGNPTAAVIGTTVPVNYLLNILAPTGTHFIINDGIGEIATTTAVGVVNVPINSSVVNLYGDINSGANHSYCIMTILGIASSTATTTSSVIISAYMSAGEILIATLFILFLIVYITSLVVKSIWPVETWKRDRNI